MQFTLEVQGTGSFLTYCMAEEDVIDSMTMGMITNNHIEGILPVNYLQIDNARYLKYHISSKISLAQYFKGVVNRHRLLTVMESIAAAVLNAEDYMLDAGTFVWDKEYIFVDAATAKASLVCLPVEQEGKNGRVNLEQFFRQLLLSVQFDQSEDCDYVAKLLGFFNANTHFGLPELQKLLQEICNNSRTVVSQKQSVQGAAMQSNPVAKSEPLMPNPALQGAAMWSEPVAKSVPLMPTPEVSETAARQEQKPEKKKFSIFGGRKEEKNKEIKNKEIKKEEKKKKQVASFNGMRIPGQENAVEASVTPIPTPSAPSASASFLPASSAPPASASFLSASSAPLSSAFSAEPSLDGAMAGSCIGGGKSFGDEERTEIADYDVTEAADSDVTQVDNEAWLELVSATQPGAMPRIELDNGRQSMVLGRISSDREQPDVAFPATFKKIGRQHAKIEKRGMDYYITDLGSLNHTFLDGVMLTPNQPYLLQDGAELALTAGKMVQYRVHI